MTPKIVIIGIDGATFDSIMPLANENRAPNFQRFISKGVWGKLKSTYPPMSPPAWISFMTGKNPGRTGIYHFWRRNFRGGKHTRRSCREQYHWKERILVFLW